MDTDLSGIPLERILEKYKIWSLLSDDYGLVKEKKILMKETIREEKNEGEIHLDINSFEYSYVEPYACLWWMQ